MSTSGIHAGSYEDTRYCGYENEFGEVCYFYGDVEVFYDPDVYMETWDCPECRYPHESGWEYEL